MQTHLQKNNHRDKNFPAQSSHRINQQNIDPTYRMSTGAHPIVHQKNDRPPRRTQSRSTGGRASRRTATKRSRVYRIPPSPLPIPHLISVPPPRQILPLPASNP